MEMALLASQPDTVMQGREFLALAAYKGQVLANPELSGSILKQLQQGVGAQQRAAAARQAAKLAKQQGGDVLKLTDQLQALQVGGGSSRSNNHDVGATSSTADAAGLLQGALLADTDGSTSTSSMGSGIGSDSDSTASSAGGVPPVTPGDITMAANALLVACKAAGALQGVPQLLERVLQVAITHGWATGPEATLLNAYRISCTNLFAAVQDVAEWAVLLHPLLVQLLPAEQGQVLASLQGRLVAAHSTSSTSSSGSNTVRQPGSSKLLSAEEVEAVLGALQHVVIPGQPGCSNPRCACLEGPSEAGVKIQSCAGCRGARYCSAACQRAHWKAGHKEVCKAAQAAAKAAAAVGGGAAASP
jgi:hypothetical protein